VYVAQRAENKAKGGRWKGKTKLYDGGEIKNDPSKGCWGKGKDKFANRYQGE